MRKELQTVINEVRNLLSVAENTLCYCELDMDRKGNRHISRELRDMYKRALTEQRCYEKVLKMLSALSENILEE